MAYFKIFRGTQAEVNAQSIVDGQMLYTTDLEGGNSLQIDIGESRKLIVPERVDQKIEETGTKINELEGYLDGFDSQIETHTTQISALASGAPKAVSLVSEMADITKNYVYTGSEDGYTAGNWYYWSGSAWTSGGLYQATGIADGAVTVPKLDSLVGAAVDKARDRNFICELGDISTVTGENVVSVTTIRTTPVFVNAGDKILLYDSAYNFNVLKYDLNGKYTTWTGFSLTPITISTPMIIRIAVKKGDNSDLTNLIDYITSSIIIKKKNKITDNDIATNAIKIENIDGLLSDNLFSMANAQQGYYNLTTGAFITSDNNWTSDYISVENGDIIKIKYASGLWVGLYYFDENYKFVKGINRTDITTREEYIKIDDENIKFIAVCSNHYFTTIDSIKKLTNADWVTLLWNKSFTPWGKTIGEINNNIDKAKAWIYLDHSELKFGAYKSGVFTSNTMDLVKMYYVTEGDILKLKIYGNQWIDNYIFFDSDDKVISYYKHTLGAETTIRITVPQGAVKLGLATVLTHLDVCNVHRLELQNKTYWQGKSMVMFGTSIPAGYGAGLLHDSDNDSYPMLMAEYLGSNMINEAVGSSCVCARKKSLVSESNPYGFIGNFEAVSRCLGNTIEEMNWVIANYNNTTVFTSNRPSSMTTDLQNKILSYSYENKLLKHLGEGNRKDLYLFEHGHNDSGTDDFTTIPTDKYDRFTYVGSMNFLIRLILKDNPRAKIAIVSHYENQLTPSIVQAQELVANYWGIPFVKLYDKIGWNQIQVATTGYWNEYGFWIESGGSEQNLTLRQIWIKDNLHPHSDKSGKANRHIAKVAAGQIETLWL